MGMSKVRLAARNAVSLFASDVFDRGASFILYALVARFLGTREFGQIALAVNLFYVFHIFAVLGMKALMTREIASERDNTGRYLLNGSFLLLVSTLVSIGTLWGLVHVLAYAEDTAFVIMFLSLGLIPYSLSAICEATFQAWERMQYIAYTYAAANAAKLLFAVVLLMAGYGLTAVVAVLVGARLLTFILQSWLVFRNIAMPVLSLDFRFCVSMLRKSMTFLGMEGVHTFRRSLNTILLSKFGGEVAVGLYSAARQLHLPANMVFTSVAVSVYPAMCRRFGGHAQNLKRIADTTLGLLLTIALPATIGLYMLAEPALVFVYGSREFVESVPALRVMTWAFISGAVTSILGQVLLASHRERINLRIVMVNAVLNVVLGFILISQFGIMGAAMTTLIVSYANLIQYYVPAYKLLSGIPIASLLWPSVVATTAMGLYINVVAHYHVLVVIVSAAVVYSLVLLGLMIVASGGVEPFKERYRFLMSS